ncbi:CNH domain-containing protein [Umbelopsis sp. AD052]|nr:CNH domain-containing protein [Umbelopsis sp. AD052]
MNGHGKPLYSEKYEVHDIEVDEPPFEDMACLSILATAFVAKVRELADMRELFCAIEYPESFSGSEAVMIIKQLIPNGYSDAACLRVARSLMKMEPPLFFPTSYAEKSLKKNSIYNSSNEIYTLDEASSPDKQYPQGIFTPITNCYVSTCRTGCYAPRCPNIGVAVNSSSGNLQRHMSLASSMASSVDSTVSRAWSANVPREILLATPEPEIKRQEAIHELIYTEEDYVRDLSLLDELFATPLATAPCIPSERRSKFGDEVFLNYRDVRQANLELYRDLTDRQEHCQAQNEAGFVDQIGDILLQHVEKLCQPYLTYGPNVVLAEYIVKMETSGNLLFTNFIREKEKQAEVRKLPFRHFLILPVTRLQRYPLLLTSVLKKTPVGHPDHQAITKALDVIRLTASKVDAQTAKTKARVRVLQIANGMRGDANILEKLQLADPSRRLFMEGHLTRRSHTGVETIDLNVFLFDHSLIMTKVKKSLSGEEEFWLSKLPIPLNLLKVQEMAELSLLKSTTASSNGTTSYANMLPALQVPSTFGLVHLGRNGGIYVLTADCLADKLAWKEKITEAKRAREVKYASQELFDIRVLSDTTFPGSSHSSISLNFGKVLCSTPFAGPQGRRMVAIGTSKGIWIGTEGNAGDYRHVLSLQNVTQLAFLEEQGILIVLADKQLLAYAIDSICGSPSFKSNERTCQKLGQHVAYFSYGTCNGRTLVVFMKKKGMDSQFKAIEPICGDLRDPKNTKFKTGRTGFLSKNPEWFKTYKEFYVGANSTAVQFLKAKLIVVCDKGFEIVDLENLNMNRNLPDLSDKQFHFLSAKAEHLQPLSMFRTNSKFLLCYDDFAFYVNNHGYLAAGGDRRWEGTPQEVILYHSYVIGFDPNFIEIRNSETGNLIQIIQGSYTRCLHYSESSASPAIHGCMAHPFKPDYQTVFQLVLDPRQPNVSGR